MVNRRRPITAVHVDIAKLAWEVSKVSGESVESTEKLRGQWITQLVDCLVDRDPSMHAYGAHLLTEVEEYRKADSERKKAKEGDGDSEDSVDSQELQPRAKQSKASKKENTRSVQGEGSTPRGGNRTRGQA